MKKWATSETPGSEHFDLKNYENITVKKEGLYFVYSQVRIIIHSELRGKMQNILEIFNVPSPRIHYGHNLLQIVRFKIQIINKELQRNLQSAHMTLILP